MKTFIFIDILSNLDIIKIETNGCGASEFQLHNLAKYLAQNNIVYFFSKKTEEEILDNIHYLPLIELTNIKYHISDAIVILQRMIHMVSNPNNYNKKMPLGLEEFVMQKIFLNNKIIVWCHDFITSGIIIGDYKVSDPLFFSNENLKKALANITNNKNILLVCVSNYQKNKFLKLIEDNKISFDKTN
jgi:hypothetical protein